ncbi:MFS transporter [Nocardioides aurantiacus]|uniref:DHA1 family inner membrane transport protein n=1 Tax=Nocardioides aurantiacus TaxID=86796 RepID=A0A3N2CRL0_9ACTN|nr:MFS transporter [Nocardioides aurantiacus]ROR90183.1 DHA1 family inner membrane transport protein [Nocardioides aurantiacus]
MTTTIDNPRPRLAATDATDGGVAARRRTAGLALLALATGAFAIGTTEFVSMGLLPQLASGVGVDIPTAGHVISAYAVGVVVGAPVLAVLGARLPRRGLLLALMGVILLGNALTSIAPSYGALMGARFVSGLPHGAFFGVAALVAADLVAPHRRAQAVSLVMTGLTVATLLGVPAATWLGQGLGWRAAYGLVVALAALTLVLLALLVPRVPADRGASGRTELRALKEPQVLLTALAGAIGFGGMFAIYTYIAPTVTEVAGQREGMVPVYLLSFGVGSVLGTLVGGRLADWSILRSTVLGAAAMGVLLAAYAVTSQWLVPGMLTVFLISASGGVFTIGLQMRLIQVAGKARTLGAALNHSALNAANALGAWLGGLTVAGGLGYPSTAWVGVGLSLLGLVVLGVSVTLQRRTTLAAATA